MSIKELENRGELQLLLFLLKKGETKITDIKIETAKSTLYNALNNLSRLELIDEKRIPPVTRILGLTGDGKAIAQKIAEIEQILAEKEKRNAKTANSQ